MAKFDDWNLPKWLTWILVGLGMIVLGAALLGLLDPHLAADAWSRERDGDPGGARDGVTA